MFKRYQYIATLLNPLLFIVPTLPVYAGGDSTDDLQLDHIVVWVEDMERTSAFLTDIVGLKRHPMKFGVSDDDATTGGMEGRFFDGNGVWLELILPTSPGPGMDILKEKGAGTIVEINFEPADYDAMLDDMEDKGISMLNMDGTPLNNDGGLIKEGMGEGEAIEHTGQRIAYWPTELSRGTTVEIFERRRGDEGSLINIRDSMWKDEKPDPIGPRIDRIAIIVKDLEASASFYTQVLGLKRHPMKFGVDADANKEVGGFKGTFIYANTIWLVLVQPEGAGPLMDILTEKGDGYAAELIIEVNDLAAYYDAMKAKGINLLNIDGTPLDDSKKAHILEPYGDKLAYFPTDVSQGMVIEIFQRGPRSTSLIHQRDDIWDEVVSENKQD